MCYDYSFLLGKIVEVYGTQYNFSIDMGLSERTISLKLNGKVPWKSTEISKAVSLLNLDLVDIPSLFFNQKVHV